MSISSVNNYWSTINSQNTGVKKTPVELPDMAQMSGPSGSGSGSDIKSFLAKVKNGTATESDLSAMKDKLTELKQKFGSTTPSIGGSGSDAITSFLDKVQTGTATTSDISSMKDTINTMETNMMAMMSGTMSSQSSAAATSSTADSTGLNIKDFLDKVQQGTITNSDLSTMQDTLNTTQQQVGSGTHHKHHSHHTSNSNNTNSSDNTNSTSTSQNNADLTQQFINSVMQAYSNSAGTSWENTSQDLKA